MKNTGKEYEIFVAGLHQALLNAEPFAQQKNIVIEVNKIIVDNAGGKREFDIYWEYELAGIIYKTIIECKDYNSNITPGKIDALIGKTKDLPDLKPVFATKKGYASGAITKAKHNKIDLLIVREQNDSDWASEDGTPLLKKIQVNSTMISSPRIGKFETLLDEEWLKKNPSLDPEQLNNFSGLNNEIFIEDLSKGVTLTLEDLERKLAPLNDQKYGTFEQAVKLENAFICYKGLKLKLLGYKVEYWIPKPIKNEMNIDFSKQLIGVIEYLQTDTKKSIFKDGLIR